MVAEVTRIRLRHELDCALWGVEAENYRREKEAESWQSCKLFLQAELQTARGQAGASASVSCDSVKELSLIHI